jgi:hypothetical protein
MGKMIATLAVLLVCAANQALAQNAPPLAEVMKSDLVKAKIRWQKSVEGGKVETLFIWNGTLERNNPNWGGGFTPLTFDVERNRAVEKAVKTAKLGQGRTLTPIVDALKAPVGDERFLSLEVEIPGGWSFAGIWCMPLARWRKLAPGLVALLEPLLDRSAR